MSSALTIIAEFGDVECFRRAEQAADCTGPLARVHQSGGHCTAAKYRNRGRPASVRS
ncbi:MAG: transposase [Planctomycetaceae bacterium]|nr:transposase [Planctomycetaceae bacterium]